LRRGDCQKAVGEGGSLFPAKTEGKTNQLSRTDTGRIARFPYLKNQVTATENYIVSRAKLMGFPYALPLVLGADDLHSRKSKTPFAGTVNFRPQRGERASKRTARLYSLTGRRQGEARQKMAKPARHCSADGVGSRVGKRPSLPMEGLLSENT